MIGDDVEVRVLRIGKEGVRQGVAAPPSVAVHRREIYDQIRAENQSAAHASGAATALAARLRIGAPKPPAEPIDELTDALDTTHAAR